MAELRDRIIGGFRVLQEIQAGSGSQGTVFKAVCDDDRHHVVPVGTVVALKVMAVQDEGQTQWRRLERRTAELAQLNHPNVVRYYGCFVEPGVFNDVHVVVQEFLQGETLKDRLARRPAGLDVDEGLKIADAAIAGLIYTSERGIVHRDVKPGNIFLCEDGAVKLIDFELARQSGGTTTSSAGNIRGSFDYMAPDFTDADFHGDVQSDIFSMGVVLHEILTGKTPYLRLEGDEKQANFAFLSRWSHALADGSNPIRVSSRIKRLLAHTEEVMARSLAPRREYRYTGFAAFRAGLKAIKFRNLRNGQNTYQMLQFIGKGGFGEVFKARLRQTGQLVAVKHLLKADYAERFYREARIMRKLHDPCFVQFVDFFLMDIGNHREAFLVMAFLDGMPGSSLRDAIRGSGDRPLERVEVLRAFERYAHGLHVMHAAGIYHRDIKPSNLYYPVGEPERAAIMDLGIARDVNGTATHGQVPGTLDYMPPEVVMTANRGDGGMDVYALGLCLYEALTGKMAYPRLPTGTAAYAAFFDRARTKKKPVFDDPEILEDAELLTLLVNMTNPELSLRIRDAGFVEVGIGRLLRARGHGSVVGVAAGHEDAKPASQQGGSDSEMVDETAVVDSATRGTAATQWGEADLAALERERHILNARRKAVQARFAKWIVRFVLAGGCVGVLAAGGFAAWRPVRNAYADFTLRAVLEEYRMGEKAVAQQRETAWKARWNPESHSWLRLEDGPYRRALERLETEKGEIERARRERSEQVKRDAERRSALERIVSCRQADGRLDEGNFTQLGDWVLPEPLEDDRELNGRLAGLARCLAAAIRDNLSIEPPRSRLARLQKARGLFRNPWTKRILPDAEAARIEREIERASKWCVTVVKNGCTSEITLDGRAIGVGAACIAVYKDGHPEKGVVARTGYKSINLPADLEGRTYEITDEAFVAKPVRVAFPNLDTGVTCTFEGRAVRGGEAVELMPGSYSCVYARETYVPQKVAFSVHVNVATAIPGPGTWVHDETYLAGVRERAERERLLRETPVEVLIGALGDDVTLSLDGREQTQGTVRLKPGRYGYAYTKTDCVPQTGSLDVQPGAATRLPLPQAWVKSRDAVEREREERLANLRAGVVEKCRELMENEPVETRQDRLDTARKVLTKAIAIDRVVSEAEGATLDEAIKRRKSWSVGKVRNRCRNLVLTVGGRAVGPGKTEVLVFESGLPEDWFCEAEGYERKDLMRDFDGRTLSIGEDDLVARDVRVRVPNLEKGVSCHFEGTKVGTTLTLKPGSYSCVYRREGYQEQIIPFEVPFGMACTLPEPMAWTARPVPVSMAGIDADVVCLVDGRKVVSDLSLSPGEHTCRYERLDYKPQEMPVSVVAAMPMSLPGPAEWEPSDGLKCLLSARNSVERRDWIAAEKLLARAEVRAEANRALKRKLEGLVGQRAEVSKTVEKAILYYEEELYYDAVKYFHEAFSLGYSMTADDLDKFESAYRAEKKRLQTMMKRCYDDMGIGKTPIRPVKDLEEEIKNLVEWHTAVKAGR